MARRSLRSHNCFKRRRFGVFQARECLEGKEFERLITTDKISLSAMMVSCSERGKVGKEYKAFEKPKTKVAEVPGIRYIK